MTEKWKRREKKIKSRKNRMPKHGRSLFLLEEITRKKSEKAKEIQKRTQIRDNGND